MICEKLYRFLEDNYGIFHVMTCIEITSVSSNRIFLLETEGKKYIVRTIIKDNFSKDRLIFACNFENRLNVDIGIAPCVYMSRNNSLVETYNECYVIVTEYISNEQINKCTIKVVCSALSLLLVFLNYSMNNSEELLEMANKKYEKYYVSNKIMGNLKRILLKNEKKISERYSKFSLFAKQFFLFVDKVFNKEIGECCVIHGDIHRDNFLYSANVAHHIIDFDNVNIDLPYLDLGYFISWSCFQDSNSKYHKIDQSMYLMIIKRISYNLDNKIRKDYLIFYVVAILLRNYTDIDEEILYIVNDYIEKNFTDQVIL